MILGIDTTSDWSSVALDDECVVWCGDRNQSMELLVRIEKLLQKKKVVFDDLTGVVVVNGPGSYTGIRIGVSVANTMGMLMGIPVKCVDGLWAQVMANSKFQIPNQDSQNLQNLQNIHKSQISNKVVSLMSAGGRRVYGRKYQLEMDKSGVEMLTDYFVGEVVDFLGEDDKDSYIVGEVNEEVENWIKSSGFEKFELLNGEDKSGRAGGAVRLWDDLPEIKNNNVIPMYLRGAVKGGKN